MTVLITGANGFIGTHLTKHINSDYKVVGQVRKIVTSTLSTASFHELEVNGSSDWEACLNGVNVVVHLASVAHNNSNDVEYIKEVNIEGTINLAKQSVKMGVKRFVFISSIAVVGNQTLLGQVFDENSVLAPISESAQAKMDAESALLKIADETSLEVVIIRPVLVYGEDAPGNFGKLVNLVKKVPVLPFGCCDNKRSFISIDNLTDFITICIDHPKAKNEMFCISDGMDVSIKEFTNEIAKGSRTCLLQVPVPKFIFYLIGKITGRQEQIDQLVGDLQVNSNKAKILLGWTPPFTMADTLSRLTR